MHTGSKGKGEDEKSHVPFSSIGQPISPERAYRHHFLHLVELFLSRYI